MRPADIYTSTPERHWRPEPELDYEGMEPRKVSDAGLISYEGVSYPISTALSGRPVGLKAISSGRLEVYYVRLLVGHIDVRAESFQAIEKPESKPGKESSRGARAGASPPSASGNPGCRATPH